MYVSIGEILVIVIVVFFLFSNPSKLLERKEMVKSVVKDATDTVTDFKQAVDELASELKMEKEEFFEDIKATEFASEEIPPVKVEKEKEVEEMA